MLLLKCSKFIFKDDLISECFSLWLTSPQKKVANRNRATEHYVQDSDLQPFFGDLSQSEKLSEIYPSLSILVTFLNIDSFTKDGFLPVSRGVTPAIHNVQRICQILGNR